MAWTSLVRNGTALQLRRGVRDDSGLAYGRFEERMNETGWNFLWLRTSGRYTDEEQMHAAGYLEGALTARLIPQHYSNWYSRAFKDELEPGDPAGGGVSAHLESLLFGQLEWARKRARRALARTTTEADDAYWQLVGPNIAQLDGLLEGYNAAAEREHRFTALPLLLLNAGSEVRTLARALSDDGGAAGSLSAQLRGSAALRRVGNELLVAHASWQPFAHMLRVWKCVRTALKHPNVAAQGLAFPSHPGLLWSHDALAYASSGLVALSTAVPLAARASADDVRARGALPGWMRALVATRSARSGDEWCRTFARYNNGALPRQWLLLDLKRWWAPAPSGPAAANASAGAVAAGLLWLLEQVPGESAWADASALLARRSMVVAHDLPLIGSIRHKTARRRGAPTVGAARGDELREAVEATTSVDGLKAAFRRASAKPPRGPTDAVAARFDLLPKASAERDFFGAIDAKVLAVGAAAGVVRAEAVSGPPEVAVVADAANKSAANRSAVNETRGAAESEAAPRTVWLRGDEEPAEADADDEGDADDGAFDWRFVPRPAAALCAEHAGQPDRFDFAWQDVGALLPPVRLDAGTATAPLADAPPRRRRRRSNSLQPDGVEAG